jgi:hypothetical protein
MMTPTEFAQKWSDSSRTERAASQEHFIDLCRMMGVPTPNEADPSGQHYAFEKGAEKTGGGDGFADVWKRGFFAWEYKRKQRDLNAAYDQLLKYREALDNPPLLVVCDLNRFEVHTNFTNTAKQIHTFTLHDLLTNPQEPLRVLRAVMTDPDALRPTQTRDELTERAAGEFASLAADLRSRGHDPREVAHFLNKLLFLMFAEDADMLPKRLLQRIIDGTNEDPSALSGALMELFGKMSEHGGRFGAEQIPWFNGGLFDGAAVLPLERNDIKVIRRVSSLDWSQVEPAIFGTLFERGLDPGKRSQLGAHYTDRRSIERVIEAVVMAPLRREFAAMCAEVSAMSEPQRSVVRTKGKGRGQINPKSPAYQSFQRFMARLRAVRILDPACGSGNFLYIALQALKDLEKEAMLWASERLHIPLRFPEVSPAALHGLEINPYAAELARVAIWIGEIQWMLHNGFAYLRDPILRPLDDIECRDAVLEDRTCEATWPTVDYVIGNPPFVGGKLMRTYLTDDYVEALFRVYDGRVPREADYVCYWHEKARAMIATGKASRAGLLATQGIRGGANRKVLARIKETGDIFFAWSDEPWVVEGASVRVSIVGYDNGDDTERTLDGKAVATINSDLTGGLDVTLARPLRENLGIAFMGDTKGGPFEISADAARPMLEQPNPHGQSNRDVIRPWVNGRDITTRTRDMWIIDFGVDMSSEDAALYEAPFEYVKERVEPLRRSNKRVAYAQRWWLHVEPRRGLRIALEPLPRCLATTTLSKHRIFVWLDASILPDHQLIVFAREDDFFFGVLQCHVHEVWALLMGTQLEDRPRYTPSTTFETFPFPEPNNVQHQAIAAAAKQLDTLREGWLNPSVVVSDLRERTLTNLYNALPTWLHDAHQQLDKAVYAAYGWAFPLDDDEIIRRLMELNLTRSNRDTPLELIPTEVPG